MSLLLNFSPISVADICGLSSIGDLSSVNVQPTGTSSFELAGSRVPENASSKHFSRAVSSLISLHMGQTQKRGLRNGRAALTDDHKRDHDGKPESATQHAHLSPPRCSGRMSEITLNAKACHH